MSRRTISLKCFTLLVLTLGCAVGLVLSHYINAPNEFKFNQPIIGPITSGATGTQTLSFDELASALARHQPDGSMMDEIVKLKSAEIELTEIRIEPSKTRPLIGPAELHRAFFLCDTICELGDGSKQRLKIKIEKNHFHLPGKSKQ